MLELYAPEEIPDEIGLPKDTTELVLPAYATARLNRKTAAAHVLTLSLGRASTRPGGDDSLRVVMGITADRQYASREWAKKADTMPRRTSPVEGHKSNWLT